MKIEVIATLRAKDEYFNELSALANALRDSTHRLDEGCLRYDLCFKGSDRNSFVFLETWESQGALDTHLNSTHLKEFRAKTEHMLEKSEVKISEI